MATESVTTEKKSQRNTPCVALAPLKAAVQPGSTPAHVAFPGAFPIAPLSTHRFALPADWKTDKLIEIYEPHQSKIEPTPQMQIGKTITAFP